VIVLRAPRASPSARDIRRTTSTRNEHWSKWSPTCTPARWVRTSWPCSSRRWPGSSKSFERCTPGSAQPALNGLLGPTRPPTPRPRNPAGPRRPEVCDSNSYSDGCRKGPVQRAPAPSPPGTFRDFQRCPRDFRGTFRNLTQQAPGRPERASVPDQRPFPRQAAGSGRRAELYAGFCSPELGNPSHPYLGFTDHIRDLNPRPTHCDSITPPNQERSCP
jgi:hypothetical protein